jgi:low affinity Fe/Cu permease
MTARPLRTWLTELGVLTAHPIAFAALGVFVAVWLITAPDQWGWHELATVATLLMTLLIQRAEHRDTQAIHAKLDELLQAEGKARSELTQIDKRDAEEIERHREDKRGA